MIHSIGTYLPPWRGEAGGTRVAGDDEDAVTLAVAAGRGALAETGVDVQAVVLVSRDLPLLEGGNGPALLAGLGLDAGTEVREQLGGAPAALEAVADAAPGELVIGADLTGGAGAAAVLCAPTGAPASHRGRVNRSLPVVTRAPSGASTDYADPRLLRELGAGESIARLGLDVPVAVVAGLTGREAGAIAGGDVPALPVTGASAAGFALADLVDRHASGCVLAVEQAMVAAVELGVGPVRVVRDEHPAQARPATRTTSEADIAISLAAYARAFDAKLRLQAARCTACGTLSYPERYRCLECGAEGCTEPEVLPRVASIYTLATIHAPVPGLATPYTIVVAELGDTGVRVLARLTGSAPGSVAIGDVGEMVFRRVAERSGVPDYGYAFLPAGDVA